MNRYRRSAKRNINRFLETTNISKSDLFDLNILIEEYYATHWRDDDSPQAEKTLGVKK